MKKLKRAAVLLLAMSLIMVYFNTGFAFAGHNKIKIHDEESKVSFEKVVIDLYTITPDNQKGTLVGTFESKGNHYEAKENPAEGLQGTMIMTDGTKTYKVTLTTHGKGNFSDAAHATDNYWIDSAEDITPPPTVPSTPGEPTDKPTDEPTDEPTDKPTDEPTDKPADEPTDKPTDEPSDNPTDEPTDKPTDEPTDKPTDKPVDSIPVNPQPLPPDDPLIEPDEVTVDPIAPQPLPPDDPLIEEDQRQPLPEDDPLIEEEQKQSLPEDDHLIDEPQKAEKTANPDQPKTGDEAPLMALTGMLMLSAGALGTMCIRRRKTDK